MLEDAIRDGDRIYATVSSPVKLCSYSQEFFDVGVEYGREFYRFVMIVNRAGWKLTVFCVPGSVGPVKTPIAESQAAAMVAAYKGIGRSPAEVDFVECHATGTSVGDPIEANWVGNYFKRDSELLIGSVKGNIG